MDTALAVIVVTGSFALMAVGLFLAKKALRRGCSVDPDACACQKEGKDPAACDKNASSSTP